MKIRKYISYLYVDFVRAFTAPGFLVSILGVLLTLLCGCCGDEISDSSVIRLIWYSTFGIQFLFVMIFGAIPYAGSICEDLEYGYIRQILIRGNLKGYCVSKIVIVLMSSICSFITGMLLFVSILRLRIQWIDISDSVYQSAIQSGSFREVIKNNHFYLYAFLFSIQLGMLIGILSLVSVYISLYISNKLLVLSIPVMAYYFIVQYTAEIFPKNKMLNINLVYGGTSNLFDNDILSFMYAVFLTIIVSVILACLIYLKLKRRLSDAEYS